MLGEATCELESIQVFPFSHGASLLLAFSHTHSDLVSCVLPLHDASDSKSLVLSA